MGAIRNAFSRITPLQLQPINVYHQLPTHDLSHNATPLDASPTISESWRKDSIGPRRRMGICLRTSPKRLFVAILSVFFVLVLLAGGGFKRAKEHYVEEVHEPERIPFHWELYPMLNGYFNGLLSLVRYDDWLPEQQASPDTEFQIYDVPPFDPLVVNPYPDYASHAYLEDHHPVEQCYVDVNEKYPAPDIYAYPGIPANMSAPYWGSHEALNVAPNRCFERFGRFGPYGYSYKKAEGGLGLSSKSIRTGAEDVEELFDKIDYRGVDWGQAQKKCYEKNQKRFDPRDSKKGALKRSAYVLRTWTGYEYTDIQLLTMRAMINELSLKSGGEFDVHLLVHVKDDNIPIWASEEAYNKTLKEHVPEEFWGIATLWSEQMLRSYYPGPFPVEDVFYNHAKADIYGVYRSAHWALQWFSQQHPEYEFFWNWEMDLRYSGHYYEFHDGISRWAAAQPRKFLWERSSRFWIPGVHGSWEQFSKMVEKETLESGEKPVWGAVHFPTREGGMLPSPNTTVPPHGMEDDDYEWGVGEDADLIVFNPLFDPSKTNWVFRDDVSGYDTTIEEPPRRAAIITVARLSRRMLNTMHEETFMMRHSMFPEMWPPSVALHHGYKAVYAPHPVYFNHKWPLDVLDQVFNHPKVPEESPFGWGEHNMQGGSFYYNAGFSGALWRRWLGATEGGDGGRKFEAQNSGRMCLRGMLHHPIKFEAVN
ncbi:hypothetical protein F4778DRAFT_785987 [Xylariomycetidae sp. FL2044]|nr:hypothetical protein F4778DRAFT_785987 [Xylariomycetidae sp. FL2044]